MTGGDGNIMGTGDRDGNLTKLKDYYIPDYFFRLGRQGAVVLDNTLGRGGLIAAPATSLPYPSHTSWL